MKRILMGLKRPNDNKSSSNRNSQHTAAHSNRQPNYDSSSKRNSSNANDQKILKKTINQYNNHTRGLPLTIENDGVTFSGFIKVRLNLRNPVKIIYSDFCLKNVVNTRKKSKSGHSGTSSKPDENEEHSKQFQMVKIPAGTLTVLHINSSTTTEEILIQLFEKYNIEKASKLYQLYTESMNSDGKIDKIPLKWSECPLNNLLVWGPKNQNFFLVLEEFSSYILDEFALFEVPELINFVKIITKEREQQLAGIVKKYDEYKVILESLIQE